MKKIFLAFLIISLSFFRVASTRAAEIVLGVVRSPDNAQEWAGITQRLDAAGIAYRTIDIAQINRASDLAGTTVIFLANIETLTPAQVNALDDWMSQGGRVIASGPVGSRSSADVRQALRSLLGASWAFPLPEPSAVQAMRICTGDWRNAPIGAKPCDTWVSPELTATPVPGGVLIPAGLSSQTAATWSCTGTQPCPNTSSPAVVTSEQATFFGWQWGSKGAASAEIDTAWLQATLSRYGEIQLTDMPVARRGGAVESRREGEGEQRQGGAVESRRGGEGAQRRGGATERDNSQPAIPKSPNPSQNSSDPAEQVAPAQPEINPDSQTITSAQGNAMRQELAELLGRVESALLSASAANNPANLATETPTEAGNKSATRRATNQGAAEKAIVEARQVLQAFPQLLAQKNYTEARRQWVAARRLLWENYPTDQPVAQPEIRAIWLDRGTIVRAGSERGLAAVFDRLAAAGFNTIFFETVNAGYPIYPSEVAPEQNPQTRRWDPLAAGVKLAHERGMELHAWVWVFAAGNQRHNVLLNQPADYPGPLISAHPDWAGYDHRGKMIPGGQTKPFLDPANPEVRRYLLKLLDEVVSRYEVDGVQLDYIRYPFQDPALGSSYGYGKAARQQFRQLAGVDPADISPSDTELWRQWTGFRIRQIDSFVAEASKLIRSRRPNVMVSAAVFPLPRNERLNKIQQNWEEWAQQGNVDLVVPMTYAMDTGGLQKLAAPWLTLAAGVNNSAPALGATLILPGIRLLNLPEVVAVDQIQALRDLPAPGYALFAAENITNRLQGIFSRTQGCAGANCTAAVPYRQPFATAAGRFKTLQRQWDFLLANNQLKIAEPQLSDFTAKTQALESSLNQLATEASAGHLATAQQSLSRFQAEFDSWMRLYSSENPYQVKTWKNHLATLDSLLRFGERVELQR
ncbi:family 10 glycosylhydrolase [Microcoleus sp. FACHB-672]|uniref:family 10 glycosylhydrolase n=1 Tax=Microcoleus sp. FACHB-672 TaxID=2692825 RepID=UPI0016874FC2|nr:family 10 glycosylhydrolase [Microcoleus sp. FACHB-672]MBD2042943.1 family 10 glycosylhydrolase [Microcoleus sp. FACHB-672]